MIHSAPSTLRHPVDKDYWIVVREGLLPLIYIPDVPVMRRTRRKIGLIERFVLECADSLRMVTPNDVEEITGIPAHALYGIFHKLHLAGLLSETAESKWKPSGHCVNEALATDEITIETVEKHGFVVLPHSDDVISIGNAKQWRKLNNLSPVCRAPISPALVGTGVIDLIRDRISSGYCSGLSDEFLGLAPCDIPTSLESTCSAYLISAAGRSRDSHAELLVTIHCSKAVSEKSPYLQVDLSSAMGLHQQLSEHMTRCVESLKPAVAPILGIPPGEVDHDDIELLGPMLFSLKIDEQAAVRCAEEGNLLGQSGIAFRVDGEWLLDCGYVLSPRDTAAAKYFVLERVIGTMAEGKHTEQESLNTLIQQCCEQYGAYKPSPESILSELREWLWKRGRFHQVYAIRKREDFAYD